jgi:hypothetical protein|tara:strand:- start:910 stop:1125 length:216 start_codon:yes stop_codon:yes gene_type:complete
MSLMKIVRGAGRLAGVVARTETGAPVANRKARLIASLAALVIALAAWAGLPADVADALGDLVSVALESPPE